jgi:hypothetical protein
MNVLIAAPDSKIPNLAIMAYSTYFKNKGYTVGWHNFDADIVVLSIIYSKNQFFYDRYKEWHPDADLIVGGPGYKPEMRLPEEVENCGPDYSIYPNYNGSIGRVTIGCIRKCYFCKVPDMGKIRYVHHARTFYRGGVCRILDDNILAHKKAFKATAEYLIGNKITANFDAFDIRLVTSDNAKLIKKIKHEKQIHLAYDDTDYEDELRRGFKHLLDAGIKSYKMMFYIYVHNENHLFDAAYRWNIVRELGADPFLMINPENLTPKLKSLLRLGTRPAANRKMTGEEVMGISMS